MLAMLDPAKAAEMQAAPAAQIDVIRTSGPGFVTKETWKWLS